MRKLHSRAGVLGGALTASTVAAIIATTVAPAPALADPVNNKKAQAAALAQQINADLRQVQILDSQYDGAQYHLTQVTQQLASAKQQMQVAQANAAKSRAALAAEAVKAYMQGGAAAPSLSSYSGSDSLAVEQGYFQLAVGNQTDALDQFRSSEQALRLQQASLSAAQSANQAAVAEVSSQRQAVQAATSASQAVLSQVQGQLVQLVAQQQAQIQAQQQAQVEASIQAAQARAAGQARAAAPAPGVSASSASSASGGGGSGNGSSSGSATSHPNSTTPATKGTSSPPITAKPSAPSSPPIGPIPAPSGGAAAAIAYARAQIGKPYQWGASGPSSFDCSGLTMMAWAQAGVSLPHYTVAQYDDTAHVPIADLQPGDLVFFGSSIYHVGLYIGGGQMIDAPYTGAFVRVDSIYWPDLQPDGGRP